MQHLHLILLTTTLMIVGFGALPVDPVEAVRSKFGTCINQSQISAEDAADVILNMNIRGEQQFKEFYFCVNKQNGVQDEDGNFLKDAVRQRMAGAFLSYSRLDHLVNDCTVKKGTGQETAYQFLLCMRKVFVGYR